jgi:hypothetical protein
MCETVQVAWTLLVYFWTTINKLYWNTKEINFNLLLVWLFSMSVVDKKTKSHVLDGQDFSVISSFKYICACAKFWTINATIRSQHAKLHSAPILDILIRVYFNWTFLKPARCTISQRYFIYGITLYLFRRSLRPSSRV